MAGYSKGIVDTRKLNKDSKAKLGRGGDTEIREVDNRESHVNALEAYLIDVNGKAGEDYAKRVGAGTVNPLTGMPEYHPPPSKVRYIAGTFPQESFNEIKGPHDDSTHSHESVAVIGEKVSDNIWTEEGGSGWSQTPEQLEKFEAIDAGLEGRQDYETLAGLTDIQLETYLQSEFGMGEDSMQYIEGFDQQPFGFLGEQQALTTKGLESSYGATMGALGSQQATLGLQGEGLTAQQTALGRTTGRGFREAGRGRDIAASRSGLASSGTITQAYETQKKDLFQDYTAGMGDIKRQRAGIGIAMEDIGRQRGTAFDTLTLGSVGAGLDFRQAEYAEKQRQLDELYADVGAIPT